MTDQGLSVTRVDLAASSLKPTILVPHAFPIQFSIYPIGYSGDSDQLQVSQAHYLNTGEPEIATTLISPEGAITSGQNAKGGIYTEISPSSFDFRNSRVWFLCPVYAARVDRQPPCTLTSAPLHASPASPAPTIPPRPGDAHVIGNGQPNLGFPSAQEVAVLATDRLWVYDLSEHSFRQMALPETPQHFRWSEFPGQPKFTSDGRFAAVPVSLAHAPLFEEGEVSHGTKLLIIDMKELKILRTIQPPKKQNLVDFALGQVHRNVTLIVSWGEDWQGFTIPLGPEGR